MCQFSHKVMNFSQNREYGPDNVSASEFINQAFNGQKGFNDEPNCAACGEEKAKSKCAKCE